MTSRERALATFQQRETDRVPVHHLGFSSEIASILLDREAYVGGGIQQWREAKALWRGEAAHQEFLEKSFRDAIDIASLCDHDIVRPNYWRYNRRPNKQIDENTFLYEYQEGSDWHDPNETHILRYDPESEQCNIFSHPPRIKSTLGELELRITEEEQAVLDYQPQEEDFSFEIQAQRLLGRERLVRAGGIQVGIPLQETETWLEAMALRPDLVARYLDIQVERSKRNIEFLVQFGFCCFFGGLDFASNDGPMYSPKLFRELILPRLRGVSSVCHEHCAYHLFASDGNLWPVADDLFGQAGIDGYYEIDCRAGMGLKELRERYPYLTLLGNISSYTLHLGSKEEVIAQTLSCLEEAKRSKGIIVGISNYILPHTPVDNVTAMLQVIRDYR